MCVSLSYHITSEWWDEINKTYSQRIEIIVVEMIMRKIRHLEYDLKKVIKELEDKW